MTEETNLDFSFSNERMEDIPPVGVHLVRVANFDTGQGQSGPYIKYTLEIQEGPFQGRWLWLYLSLSEKARFKLNEFLDAVEAPKKGTSHPEDFVGAVFRVMVEHEEYNGRKQAKPTKMFPKGYKGQGPTPKAKPKSDFDEEAPKTDLAAEGDQKFDDPFED